MDAKSIKKLADMCRKVGIKHFKDAEVEFTLADVVPPVSRRPKRSMSVIQETLEQSEVQIDDTSGLSDEELLYWSSGTTEEN